MAFSTPSMTKPGDTFSMVRSGSTLVRKRWDSGWITNAKRLRRRNPFG